MTIFKRNKKGELKTQIGKDGKEYLIPTKRGEFKMKIITSAIAGSRISANQQALKYRKKYSQGYRVTIKKNKTSKKLQKSYPGKYGPFWYAVNVWKI